MDDLGVRVRAAELGDAAATRLVEETDGEAFVAVDLIDTEVRGVGGSEGVVVAAGESRRGERRGRENA